MTEPQQQPAPTGIAIAECRHGRMMYLRGDIYVGKSLERYGEFSEIEVAALLRLIGPGDFVVDAGANVGAISIPLAKRVGPRGSVLSFEPQLAIFHILAGNIALNELTQVEALRIALGDRRSTISIPSLGYRAVANYGGLGIEASAPEIEQAPLRRLDEFELERVRLIKADVEGSEGALLDGAVETIRRCRPILWIENDRKPKSRDLISRLLSLGYRLWWHIAPLYNPANFRRDPVNVIGHYVSINLLCVPTEMQLSIAGLRAVDGPDDWWK